MCRCGCECHSIYVWRSEDNLELILSCLVPRIKLFSSGIEGGAFAHQVISLAYLLCLKFQILCHEGNLCQRMSTKDSHFGGFLSLRGNLFWLLQFLTTQVSSTQNSFSPGQILLIRSFDFQMTLPMWSLFSPIKFRFYSSKGSVLFLLTEGLITFCLLEWCLTFFPLQKCSPSCPWTSNAPAWASWVLGF